MSVLAIDTSMQACSAAVFVDGRLSEIFEARARGHADAIMPMISRVMAEAGVGFDTLDKLAVTTGPGTFTGVRVGVAAARGLALATSLPLIGRSSLWVMARGLASTEAVVNGHTILIAADARRGEVYWALFDAEGNEMRPPAASSPTDVVAKLPNSQVVVAGSGASLIGQAAGEAGKEISVVREDLLPRAGWLATGAANLEAPSEPPKPLYLRAPDAKPQTDKVLPWRN